MLALLHLSHVLHSAISTAYCLRGTMANGHLVHWGAIATDPSVIPTGSKLLLFSTVKTVNNHIFTAEDTGGAIIDQRIDIWFSSCIDAIKFGVKKIFYERI